MKKILALAAVLVGMAVSAQDAPRRPVYDAKAETTVTGRAGRMVVRELGKRKVKVSFLVAKTATGRQILLLGPERYVSGLGLDPDRGQDLSAVGCMVQGKRQPVLLVRALTVGGRTVVLRDEDGTPKWREAMAELPFGDLD